MRARLTAIALALLSATGAHAITFAPGTRDDPFAPGKTCDAPMLEAELTDSLISLGTSR